MAVRFVLPCGGGLQAGGCCAQEVAVVVAVVSGDGAVLGSCLSFLCYLEVLSGPGF